MATDEWVLDEVLNYKEADVALMHIGLRQRLRQWCVNYAIRITAVCFAEGMVNDALRLFYLAMLYRLVGVVALCDG